MFCTHGIAEDGFCDQCSPCINCGCERLHRNCQDLVVEQELIHLILKFRKEHNRWMVHNVIHTLRCFREGVGLVDNVDDHERNEFHMPNGETWHN